MSDLSKRSSAATVLLQLFYASGRMQLCAGSYDLRELEVAEGGAVAALTELRQEGLLAPETWHDEIALTPKGRCVIQEIWAHGQLPDAFGPRRIVGHFPGELDLPVRIAVPPKDSVGTTLRKFALGREWSDLGGGGFSAWELVYAPTGHTEDRLLIGLHSSPGAETGHPGGRDHDWIRTWVSVDREGDVREERLSLEEIVFLIAMAAA